MTMRSKLESSKSLPCAPCAYFLLYRQLRLIGRTMRPIESGAGALEPSAAGTIVALAMTVPVVRRKSRRSMRLLLAGREENRYGGKNKRPPTKKCAPPDLCRE